MITIKQAPNKFQPVYNEIPFVVSSDKTAQPNFLYVCDIYVTGITTPAYIRIKHSADPLTGFALFDIHREIENFVSKDISTSLHGFQTNNNSFIEYQCSFGEEFGLSSSGTTVYAGQTSGTVNYAYNGVFDFLDFQNYSQTPYLIGLATNTAKFLTNAPTSVYIRSTENAWLHAMTDIADSIVRARVITYNAAGAVIQVVEIVNPYAAVLNDQSKFVRFDTGTKNLNLISSGDIIIGAQPIITASVQHYTVELIDTNGDTSSEVRTYVINDACSKYEAYRFHFLNKPSGFDSFTFNRLSRQTSAIARQRYKKNLGTITPVTGAYGYSKSDAQDVIFDVNLKDGIGISSDWLTDAESAWLEELVSSPVVFHDHPTHGLIAVNILNATFEPRKSVNDKIVNLLITFEYTYNRTRQRG
jgi:hypothetical protein